jgi:16S rRNA (uracil1498-N3)-methyltransferase
VLDRFYCPSLSESPIIHLRDEEFHHLARVLRKEVGDRVALFDGRGQSAEGVIESVGKRDAHVRVEQLHEPAPDSRVSTSLATPVPKGDRGKWLVEKLTELGVDTWTPLLTSRSVIEPGLPRLERLQQSVIAACKQCGRNRLLEVDSPLPWQEWLLREREHGPILIADPAGEPINDALERLTLRPPWRLCAAVGPEGGFAAEELDLARRTGAVCVRLGTNILRIETAAIALAAILRLR